MIQITKGVHTDYLIVMIRFYHLIARIYKITPVSKKLEPFISQINPYAMFEGWRKNGFPSDNNSDYYIARYYLTDYRKDDSPSPYKPYSFSHSRQERSRTHSERNGRTYDFGRVRNNPYFPRSNNHHLYYSNWKKHVRI